LILKLYAAIKLERGFLSAIILDQREE